MAKLNKKTPVFIYVAIILFILLVITTRLTGGMFARYASFSEFSDGSRVATFKVSEDFFETEGILSINIIPGETDKKYTFTVINNSEVAVECTISVLAASNNLPISITCVNEDYPSGVIPVGKTAKVSLVVSWVGAPDPGLSNFVDVYKYTVSIVQVD